MTVSPPPAPPSSPSWWSKIPVELRYVGIAYAFILLAAWITIGFLSHIENNSLNAVFAKDVVDCKENYIKAFSSSTAKVVEAACMGMVLKLITGKACLLLLVAPLGIATFVKHVFEVVKNSIDEGLNPLRRAEISRLEMMIAALTLPMFVASAWCAWIYLAGSNYIGQIGFIAIAVFGLLIAIALLCCRAIILGLTSKR